AAGQGRRYRSSVRRSQQSDSLRRASRRNGPDARYDDPRYALHARGAWSGDRLEDRRGRVRRERRGRASRGADAGGSGSADLTDDVANADGYAAGGAPDDVASANADDNAHRVTGTGTRTRAWRRGSEPEA